MTMIIPLLLQPTNNRCSTTAMMTLVASEDGVRLMLFHYCDVTGRGDEGLAERKANARQGGIGRNGQLGG
jgi:hypothetical protein